LSKTGTPGIYTRRSYSDHGRCGEQVTIVLSTGYVCGWLVAMVLDNILPREIDPADRIRDSALHSHLRAENTPAHLIEMGPDPKVPPPPPCCLPANSTILQRVSAGSSRVTVYAIELCRTKPGEFLVAVWLVS